MNAMVLMFQKMQRKQSIICAKGTCVSSIVADELVGIPPLHTCGKPSSDQPPFLVFEQWFLSHYLSFSLYEATFWIRNIQLLSLQRVMYIMPVIHFRVCVEASCRAISGQLVIHFCKSVKDIYRSQVEDHHHKLVNTRIQIYFFHVLQIFFL